MTEESIPAAFETFRTEIDDYNDRRDRLIKSSRDITTASKRLIFQLHRYPHREFRQPSEKATKVIHDGQAKLREIIALMNDMANREDLCGQREPGRALRHDRAYGGGLEEFIEAASFLYFIEHRTIITLQEVRSFFVDENGQTILPVTPQRYLLGLSDLSGELMRFATNAIGAGDTGEVVKLVLDVLRQLSNDLDPFVPLIRDFRRKQTVTCQSLRKIEDISYAIKVRSAEFGSDPSVVREMLQRALASGQDEQTNE